MSRPSAPDGRPGVAVICPFHGSAGEAEAIAAALTAIERQPDDQLILVDNTANGVVGELGRGVEVISAPEQQSSYYARNRGAERTSCPWLLFVDSDTRPDPDIIDRYLETADETGASILAGAVRPDPDQPGLIARYARSRGHIDPEFHLAGPGPPAGITANLLVSQDCWDSVGGFHEGIRSGADIDFCWRAHGAGWRLEASPQAAVMHRHVETLGAMVRKTARHAAGRIWLNRLHPGAAPRPRVAPGLLRCLVGVVGWTLTLRFERALFKAIDAVWILSDGYGYSLGDNRATGGGLELSGRGALVADDPGLEADRTDVAPLMVLTDAYPARSETFITAEARGLAASGWSVSFVSRTRPPNPDRDLVREMCPTYLSDAPPVAKARALVRLVARHPIASLRDRLARRRWARTEAVWPLAAAAPLAQLIGQDRPGQIHIHFVGGAAMLGLRMNRILGIPYSLFAHAYEVFQVPRNIAPKVGRSSFTAAASHYTLDHLRASLDPGLPHPPLERVITGVDLDVFTRSTPAPDGDLVVTVGRLVEKKGFEYLIRSAVELAEQRPAVRVRIIGDGPLRGDLDRLIEELELGGVVEIDRVWGPDAIRAELERASVFCLPCVVAADGDRDSMPNSLLEAMAMELPCVGTDQVGLPEVIDPAWGRLVPPRDPAALAGALAELLSLDREGRVAMGAAARGFIESNASVEVAAARMDQLLRGAAADPESPPQRS